MHELSLRVFTFTLMFLLTPQSILCATLDIKPVAAEGFLGLDAETLPPYIGTPYQVLEDQFKKAERGSLKKINKLGIGRCYFRQRPMHPYASVLAPFKNRGHGPLFERATLQHLIPLVTRIAPAEYFDRMDAYRWREIESVLPTLADRFAFIHERPTGLEIEGLRTLTAEQTLYELRQRKKYWILAVICNEEYGCRSEARNRISSLAGEVAGYCYYSFRE